jgi:hypothetical protein
MGTAAAVSSVGLTAAQRVVVLAVQIFLACQGVAFPIVTMLVLDAVGKINPGQWLN